MTKKQDKYYIPNLKDDVNPWKKNFSTNIKLLYMKVHYVQQQKKLGHTILRIA